MSRQESNNANQQGRWCHIAICICIGVTVSGWADQVSAQWSMGGRAIALAKTGTAWPSDAWAVFHNPALIDAQERHFGFFAIRYYGLRELEDHAAVISFPVGFPFLHPDMAVGIAAGIHSYGFDLYRETQIRGGWSVHRNPLRAGLAVNYVHLHISGYGSAGKPVVNAGITAELPQNVKIGYRIANLLPGSGSHGEVDLHPAEMAIGLSWRALPRLLLVSDLVKDVIYPISFRTAMEWEGFEDFYLRGGWTTNPLTWSTGIGLHRYLVSINIAVQKHPVLGISPGLDATITF